MLYLIHQVVEVLGMTKYYENEGITTIVKFVFAGHGIDAQEVYSKRITTFSVSDGVIKDNEYIPCKAFFRVLPGMTE